MGMNVFGQNPATETDVYFRRAVWGWHPLAQYIIITGPKDILTHCVGWHSNDGDGLNAERSQLLSQALLRAVGDGSAARYVNNRDRELAAAPDEICLICLGSGVRSDPVGVGAGQNTLSITDPDHPRSGQKGWCNGCDGKGTVRPWETNYPLAVSDIEEFAAFLRDCGGFEIC